ncbi:MAG: GTPase Era [Candidatus Omnitrophica bacterium]|nr:GTPase Era [Candidatus Omnitrophota bacterium]
MNNEHKSGYVALIGRPNAGKSTLLNQILQTKLVAVTPRPQTTRHRIFGIYDCDDAQIVFQDTPGLLQPDDAMHEFMMREANRALADADLAVWLIDGVKGVTKRETVIASNILAGLSIPLLVVFNKMDVVPLDRREDLIKGIRNIPLPAQNETLYISALKGGGVEALVEKILSHLNPGPKFFPPDQLSDRTQRFFVEEIIREQAFMNLKQEIPYSLAVQVESMKEKENGVLSIQAALHVERDAQKRILIGKKGAMIKLIGTQARGEIERIMQQKVFLELWVKVSERWRKRGDRLREFGFIEQD